jgi:hypothetical protein
MLSKTSSSSWRTSSRASVHIGRKWSPSGVFYYPCWTSRPWKSERWPRRIYSWCYSFTLTAALASQSYSRRVTSIGYSSWSASQLVRSKHSPTSLQKNMFSRRRLTFRLTGHLRIHARWNGHIPARRSTVQVALAALVNSSGYRKSRKVAEITRTGRTE